MQKLTPEQRQALEWLNDHGCEARFITRGERVLAFNTVSPYNRPVWLALRNAGLVRFERGKVVAV